MKIVIDLQGAQTPASGMRGVGRYSAAFATAIARHAGAHDVWICLSALFPQTIEAFRASFDGLVPQERIVVWQTLAPTAEVHESNRGRMLIGETMRESFLASLKPDVVHVSNVFEGMTDDGLVSIHRFDRTVPTSVTLYDLIPLANPEIYLDRPKVKSWYERKLDGLRRAQMWLAISEASRQEGISHLDLPAEWVLNVSAAADPKFRPVALDETRRQLLRARYGLTKPFVMYTAGIDRRKNIDGLIRSYASLPRTVRADHQLAIVCTATPEQTANLEWIAQQFGLAQGEMVVTGFVSDDDLVDLCNLCELFVFPSWHEGFGLPALEAMSCGAATIGANTSSLPEVIGRDDAMFDPHDDRAITHKLHEALTDKDFRQDLRRHALVQATKFSWSETARRAVDGFEKLERYNVAAGKARLAVPVAKRPTLAYVSPLPPQRSGIADYSAELLPELARHYDIDVIVDQPTVGDAWIRANTRIRDADWFDRNARQYDRVLYHFGNSEFHRYMFRLLDRRPGTIVLHDFYLSGVIGEMDRVGIAPGTWQNALYEAHGYSALETLWKDPDPDAVSWKYPANLTVLRKADGLIVHSSFALELADRWYGHGFSADWARIPLLRKAPDIPDRSAARRRLRLAEGDYIVCAFGVMGPTKLNNRLIETWAEPGLAGNTNSHLIFVGEEHRGSYGAECRRQVARHAGARRIHFAGYSSPEVYRDYLAAADVAVQLRTLSRGESSASLLECMAYGLPTIANALGSTKELPKDCMVQLTPEFSNPELFAAIVQLREAPNRRTELGQRARAYVLAHHDPRAVANQYFAAIERFADTGTPTRVTRAINEVAKTAFQNSTDSDWLMLAQYLAQNEQQSQRGPRQCFVDISELVRRDSRSGIQRVVRNVLLAWLDSPPEGFRIEPVFCDDSGIYRYARRFTAAMLDIDGALLANGPIEMRNGDIFVALDLFIQPRPVRRGVYEQMRQLGVRLYFVVYDLLLVRHPEFFDKDGSRLMHDWLVTLAELADGAVCISRSVADELNEWLHHSDLRRDRPLNIGWFHLGSDAVDNRADTPHAPSPLSPHRIIANRANVLMVGTVEPRKCHAQVLSAFEHLWQRGAEATLVIAGRQGWMVDSLVKRLRDHPEFGRRLFWHDAAGDDELKQAYLHASGVLLASRGEGFGLPIVEAAEFKKPLLLRDLPVFREIAGDGATYFSGLSAESLAASLQAWLLAVGDGSAPDSSRIARSTWKQSAARLKNIIFGDNWYAEWHGSGVAASARTASAEHPPRADSMAAEPAS